MLNVKPKRSLGQNFLVDNNVARKIVRDGYFSYDDVVVEIGPGKGVLTQYLVEKVKHVYAVEIDGRFIGQLRDKFRSSNIDILHKDFLDISLLDMRNECGRLLKIIGNIPYHLTSPIFFKIFNERSAVDSVILMVQLEVAKRVVASYGTSEYGILSVLLQYMGKPKILFKVSASCFYPKPKVTSAVVQIKNYPNIDKTLDEDIFTVVVKTAFGKRRKKLSNSLKYLPYDESIIDNILSEIDFPLDQRPENLSVKQFINLTRQIQGIVQ